jgi:hypothetical protein
MTGRSPKRKGNGFEVQYGCAAGVVEATVRDVEERLAVGCVDVPLVTAAVRAGKRLHGQPLILGNVCPRTRTAPVATAALARGERSDPFS